jgi:hypothetical protein
MHRLRGMIVPVAAHIAGVASRSCPPIGLPGANITATACCASTFAIVFAYTRRSWNGATPGTSGVSLLMGCAEASSRYLGESAYHSVSPYSSRSSAMPSVFHGNRPM